MLKKFIYVALLSFSCGGGSLSAKSITPDLAKTVAVNFFKNVRQSEKTVSEVVESYAGGILTGYAVNFREGGWVMVSANDVIEPIICFNVTGNFSKGSEDEEENPILEVFADGIKVENTSLKSSNAKVKAKWDELIENTTSKKQNGLKSLPTITYKKDYPNLGTFEQVPNFLIDEEQRRIEWNQYRPYNDFCPKKSCSQTSNGRTPAGCTAIAVSQIVNWGYFKDNGFDWKSMPARQVSSSSAATLDMSRAIKQIADQLHTEYTCNGSSAYLQFAPPILKSYGFDWISPYFVKEKWGKQEWIEMMKSELKYLKPILADGVRKNKTGGHAFIVSGYEQLAGYTWFYCNMGQQNLSLNCYYNFADNQSDYISNNTMKGMYIGLEHYQIYQPEDNNAVITNISTNGITIKERVAANYLLIVYNGNTVVEKTAGCLEFGSPTQDNYHIIKPKNTPKGNYLFDLVVFGNNGTRYFHGRFDRSTPYESKTIGYNSWPEELISAVGWSNEYIELGFENSGMLQYAKWMREAYASPNYDVEDDILLAGFPSLVVSPNPNDGHFTVSIRAFDGDGASVVVTDAIGNTIKTYRNVKESLEVNLGNVEPGMYFVRAISANNSKVEKIIVK